MTEEDERRISADRLITEMVRAAATQPHGLAFVLCHHDFSLIADHSIFEPPGTRMFRGVPVLPASTDRVQGSYLIAEDFGGHALVIQVRT